MRTKPKGDEDEAVAWETYYACVEAAIQIVLNTCVCKYIVEKLFIVIYNFVFSAFNGPAREFYN